MWIRLGVYLLLCVSATVLAMDKDTACQLALQTAAKHLQVNSTNLRIESVEAVTWRNGSLGCPQADMMYTQALVPGYRIRVLHGDNTHWVHTGRDNAIVCERPAENQTVPSSPLSDPQQIQ